MGVLAGKETAMGKNRKWLLGPGIAAACAAALGAVRRGVSKHLVRLAMDRDGTRRIEESFEKISGGLEHDKINALVADARKRLEENAGQTVEIQSRDGTRLVGHWYPCETPRRIIIAMHGWRSSWSRDFGMVADFWHENQCSVLFAEQRGQGESGGEYIGFGMLERYDCLEWVKWADARNPENLPIYLSGVSMGATTVLMAGGLELPENVHGITADCGFTSAHDIWKHVAEKNLHLHYGLYAAAADDLCKKKINMGANDYSTVEAMARCKVPVLFAHGTDDSFVPVEMTYENYKACVAPKRLFIVPGADHAMSYLVDREGYQAQVKDFWKTFDGN